MNVKEYMAFLDNLKSQVKDLPETAEVKLFDECGVIDAWNPSVIYTGEYDPITNVQQIVIGQP